MTAIDTSIRPVSPAGPGHERADLVLWLLTVEGELASDLFSISSTSKVFGEVVTCILYSPECSMFGWPAAYAVSFRLASFIEHWRDPRPCSVFIIDVGLSLVALWCFGRLGYGWSAVANLAPLLRRFSWLLLLFMWLLLLGLYAIRLDFWIGGAVRMLFRTVKFSILSGQQLDVRLKSWL